MFRKSLVGGDQFWPMLAVIVPHVVSWQMWRVTHSLWSFPFKHCKGDCSNTLAIYCDSWSLSCREGGEIKDTRARWVSEYEVEDAPNTDHQTRDTDKKDTSLNHRQNSQIQTFVETALVLRLWYLGRVFDCINYNSHMAVVATNTLGLIS